MTAETDAVLRMAARIIMAEAKRLPQREVAREQFDDHRDAPGMRRAAAMLETMTDPEEG